MKIDSKSIIAGMVILGCFALLGIYVWQNRTPDAVVAAIIGGALMGVVNFFFGHLNGTVTGLAQAAAQLANQVSAQMPAAAPQPPPIRVVPPQGGSVEVGNPAAGSA